MSYNNIWFDLDTGTILNGPVVQVPSQIITEDMTDQDVIDVATSYAKEN